LSSATPDQARRAAGGKIARQAAEYNLVEHCNLRCAACDHSSPLLPSKFADVAELRRDLRVLSEVLHLQELKLLGGEPLLHPKLLDCVQSARASDIADRITLVTNGLLLHRCDPAVLDLIDVLWISLYPGVKLPIGLDELTKRAVVHDFELSLREIDTFRVTTINTRNRDDKLVRRIFDSCALAHGWSCHTIYEGAYFKCSPAPFLSPRLALKGVNVQNRDSDGVRIHGNPHLREELETYLSTEEPLEACYFCLGSSGKSMPHRQLAKREIDDEINAEHYWPMSLLDRPVDKARRGVNRTGRAVRRALKQALKL
jgi:organic radical activating enzyme